jgi:preprotein translocase subunit SecY
MSISEPAPVFVNTTWRRLLITIGVLLLYRAGCQIPLPGLDLDSFGGPGGPTRSFERISIFAVGVVPIFSVLIVVEIAKLACPALGRWEAADAKKAALLHRVAQIAALVIAAFHGLAMAHALAAVSGLVADPDWTFDAGIVATIVAATALLGWLGELVTRRGVGNGFWLLLVAPYLAGLPSEVLTALGLQRIGAINLSSLYGVAIYFLLAIFVVVALARTRAAPGAHGSGEGAMDRACSVDVWPAVLAKYVGVFLITALVLGLNKSINTSVFAVGNALHAMLTAVLIAGFAFMRARFRPGDVDGRPLRIIALAQIVICCFGELAPRVVGVALDGVWLIVIVATAMNCLASLGDGARAIPHGGE